jgi:hypothetical protein
MAMTSLIGFAVVLTLLGMLVAAGWVYSVLDRMLTRVEGKVKPHVPVVKQRLNAAAQYARPRAAGWARRMALGLVAHAAVFFGAAAVVALVRPAPEKLTYESLALSPAATWFQRNAAYVSINSGLGVRDVKPGFLVSTARLADGSVLVGLPGTQKWYRL